MREGCGPHRDALIRYYLLTGNLVQLSVIGMYEEDKSPEHDQYNPYGCKYRRHLYRFTISNQNEEHNGYLTENTVG